MLRWRSSESTSQKQLPKCLKWILYWLFDSLDEGEANDKISKDSSYELENLNLQLIGKKLREEEDKKNIKENRKGTKAKTSKPVNAVSNSGMAAQRAGLAATKSTNPRNKLSQARSGINNGIAPEGKKLIDAPACNVKGCMDHQHRGWCNIG